ncbi:8670_t:CDS:2 [Funneliformis geosporum]|uniref:8670_t:CDS:1 n=1 Tax=Funneliformis geosporum TaxID=1117311 RepID=A0A9W4WRT9_9GLOM|nr:8670_t:CDS:2 [Funneliformis geosporum]
MLERGSVSISFLAETPCVFDRWTDNQEAEKTCFVYVSEAVYRRFIRNTSRVCLDFGQYGIPYSGLLISSFSKVE